MLDVLYSLSVTKPQSLIKTLHFGFKKSANNKIK